MAAAARILELARRGPITARDLRRLGIGREWLFRLCERGELQRIARGVYRAQSGNETELASVVEVAKRAPKAVMCLLTALQIHGLTTELPHEVWIQIHNRARRPRIGHAKVRVVRASGKAASHGIERRSFENTAVLVTSPAKTVADCFRYRSHVGLETAIAALRDYLRRVRPAKRSGAGSGIGRGAYGDALPSGEGFGDGGPRRVHTIDALIAAARADGVYSVLRPYLEALA